MKFRQLILSTLLVCALPTGAPAQTLDHTALNRDGLAAASQGDWEKSLAIFTTATRQPNARRLFGPKFGHFWYRRGLAEFQLGHLDEALRSLDICLTEYANLPDTPEPQLNRAFLPASIARAEILKQQGKEAEAHAELLRLAESPAAAELPSLRFQLAGLHFQAEPADFEKGLKEFNTALSAPLKSHAAVNEAMACFNRFCEALISSSLPKKDRLTLFHDFFTPRRHLFLLDPEDATPYGPHLLKLAVEATNAGLHSMAGQLYALVPDYNRSVPAISSRLATLGNLSVLPPEPVARPRSNREKLLADLKLWENSDSPARSSEALALAASGQQAENLGHHRAAYAAFQQLELRFSDHPRREQHLHRLIALATRLQDFTAAETFATRHLELFPESSLRPEVINLHLAALYYGERYQACVETASALLPDWEPGTPNHDSALHFLGGSHHYLGNYSEAASLLEQHFNQYVASKPEPASPNTLASTYLHASNFTYLHQWDKAAPLLEAFLENYPAKSSNPYLASALYDLANAHYHIGTDGTALKLLKRSLAEFPTATGRQLVLVLQGRILVDNDHPNDAAPLFTQALELSRQREDPWTAAEALYRLIELNAATAENGDATAQAEVLKLFETFASDHPDPGTPFSVESAEAALPAFIRANRPAFITDYLGPALTDLAESPAALPLLKRALTTYRRAYSANHAPKEVASHFFELIGINPNRTLRSYLLLASVEAWEEELNSARDAKDQNRSEIAEAQIFALFKRLSADVPAADLTPSIALRLANYLAATDSPDRALPYYRSILDSDADESLRLEAQFGIADLLGAAASGETSADAVATLQQLAETPDLAPNKRTLARYRIITIHRQNQNWPALQKSTFNYINDDSNDHSVPEVVFLHALAFDKQGNPDSAATAYFNCFNAYRHRPRVAAPSLKRWMEIIWERNQDRDRQLVYENGAYYIHDTKQHYSKWDAEARKLWDQTKDLVEHYESLPEIEARSFD